MLPITVKERLTEEETAPLRLRWMKLCAELTIPENEAEGMFDQLHYEYADWNRYYHGLSHLQSLFAVADQYTEHILRKDLLDLAIWFHDMIYKAKRKDNEHKSAVQAAAWLQDYLSDEDTEHVKQLILSTCGHQPLTTDPDCLYFLDFDLSILASERETYKKYSAAIASEYSSLFSFLYYKSGRKQVLYSFLDRERLYFTKEFYEQYEAAARKNIEWELEHL